ncbi:MAG: HEAT repeat domain-containing protein [Acidobacteriota bacterium]
MRHIWLIVIVVLTTVFLNLPLAVAGPIPALNLQDLVRDSDLIAVGRVAAVQEAERANIDADGQSISARQMIATVEIYRVVKGRPDETSIRVGFLVPEIPLGYAGIAAPQFGMFFLRRSAKREYVVVNPYYPFVVASTNAPLGKGSDLDRVTAEVAQVLVVPGASPDERRRAIDVLARVNTNLATVALRSAAKDRNAPVRLKAAAVLLRRDDASILSSVEDVLVNPPQGIDPGLLRSLAFAIQDGIKNHESIPVLVRLLRARDVQTRRAAAAALRHTEADAAIAPLSEALEDADREVRYHAVLGLAIITGQTEWGPAIDQFERDEHRYMTYWREWVRRR